MPVLHCAFVCPTAMRSGYAAPLSVLCCLRSRDLMVAFSSTTLLFVVLSQTSAVQAEKAKDAKPAGGA